MEFQHFFISMRLALFIEYDGKDFAGWQFQPNLRTVQGELESSLRQISGLEIPIYGSGRTDTGVHAYGMVAHIELPDTSPLTIAKMLEGLNATSGYDVVVKDIRQVPEDFHARFSATSREYHYWIRKGRTAMFRNLSWQIHSDLDWENVQAASQSLIGEHDFTSFSKRSEDVNHYRSIITQSDWSFEGENAIYTIKANRFVRGMVRALVGALIEIGKGRMTLDQFSELLNTPTEFDRARHISPAEGLTLWRIEYPDVFNLW